MGGVIRAGRRRQVRFYGLLILGCLALLACTDPEGRSLQTLALDAGCDVRAACVGRAGNLRVSVRMAPHRSALIPFNVALSSDADLESVIVSLEMQGMDMGQNRYRLLKVDGGSWQADITLPVCASGRSDWVAVFELQADGRRYRLEVPFTLGE